MEENVFNGYILTDEEILNIIGQSINVINRNAKINGVVDEDLKEEIIVTIYEQLTSGRRKNKKI